MRVLPYGDRALLAEFDSLELALGAHASWSATPPPGVVELVPGARTVLVRIDPEVIGLGHAEYWLREHPVTALDLPAGDTITLPAVYDGDDLDAVAAAWGCSVDDVAQRHSDIEWVCAFIGFTAGFGYLVPAAAVSLPPVPRRATSRPQVPAGSIALAADYCGVYPRASAGGWQLIGRTNAVLWDAERDPPALVTPGTRVRFTEVQR